MAVTLQVETEGVASLAEGLNATPRQVTAIVKSVMGRAMLLAERRAKEIARTAMRVRTGLLIKSIRSRVEQDADAIYGLLGIATTGSKVLLYAAVQELGTEGPIRAKRAYRNVPGGPYLNIPLAAALTPAGVQRFSAREAEDVYSGGTFIARSRKGNWILFGSRGDDVEPLFVLKKEVPAIPPKHFLRTGVEEVLPYIADAIGATIQDRFLLGGAS